MDSIAKIAEQKILEAMENGELDDLPGKGQPLDLGDLRNVPPELRLEYKVLKNAGLIPEELSVKQEIAALEELLRSCISPDEKSKIQLKIAERSVYYNLLMERRRRKT